MLWATHTCGEKEWLSQNTILRKYKISNKRTLYRTELQYLQTEVIHAIYVSINLVLLEEILLLWTPKDRKFPRHFLIVLEKASDIALKRLTIHFEWAALEVKVQDSLDVYFRPVFVRPQHKATSLVILPIWDKPEVLWPQA